LHLDILSLFTIKLDIMLTKNNDFSFNGLSHYVVIKKVQIVGTYKFLPIFTYYVNFVGTRNDIFINVINYKHKFMLIKKKIKLKNKIM